MPATIQRNQRTAHELPTQMHTPSLRCLFCKLARSCVRSRCWALGRRTPCLTWRARVVAQITRFRSRHTDALEHLEHLAMECAVAFKLPGRRRATQCEHVLSMGSSCTGVLSQRDSAVRTGQVARSNDGALSTCAWEAAAGSTVSGARVLQRGCAHGWQRGGAHACRWAVHCGGGEGRTCRAVVRCEADSPPRAWEGTPKAPRLRRARRTRRCPCQGHLAGNMLAPFATSHETTTPLCHHPSPNEPGPVA